MGGEVARCDSEIGRKTILDHCVGSAADAANGSFAAACLVDDGRRLCLLSDAVGSVALYYARVDAQTLAVSTDPRELVEALPNPAFDTAAIGELIAFGYVLEDRTLFRGVREVPPATLLRFDAASGDVASPRQETYWRCSYSPSITTVTDFANEAECVVDKLAGRYSRYVDSLGLPCLVKLTGGGDSRLLLAMLIGRAPLRTATYGYPGWRDLVVARSLSRQLGIEHSFARLRGDEAVCHAQVDAAVMASGLRSISHPSLGSIAVIEAIPDATYCHVPGHAADFVAGSHLRPPYFSDHDPEDRLRHLVNAHVKVPGAANDPRALSRLLASPATDESLQRFVQRTAEQPTWQAMQEWNLQNRQRRFILSDAAALRANGPVLLPFWDFDFVRLFERTSVGLLRGEAAHRSFCQTYTDRVFGDRLRIQWPINRTSYLPIIQEAASTASLATAYDSLLDLGRRASHKLFGIKLRPASERYMQKLSSAERAELAEQALHREGLLSASLSEEGVRVFRSEAQTRLIEVDAMIASWQRTLTTSTV